MNNEKRIAELNAKLIDLKTKRTVIYNEINCINDEIQKIKWGNDDLVGTCWCESEGDKPTNVHYKKILSVNDHSSNNCGTTWYNYLYINASDTFMTISFSIGTKEDIFEGTCVEITTDEFNVQLNDVMNNMLKRVNKIKK